METYGKYAYFLINYTQHTSFSTKHLELYQYFVALPEVCGGFWRQEILVIDAIMELQELLKKLLNILKGIIIMNPLSAIIWIPVSHNFLLPRYLTFCAMFLSVKSHASMTYKFE